MNTCMLGSKISGLVKISGVTFSAASYPDFICFSWRCLAIFALILYAEKSA